MRDTPSHVECFNRMPAVIEPPDYDTWLSPDPNLEVARHLLQPYPAEKMGAYRVSALVNNSRNDDPQCISRLS